MSASTTGEPAKPCLSFCFLSFLTSAPPPALISSFAFSHVSTLPSTLSIPHLPTPCPRSSKSPAHQSGCAHVTSHRLFFITDDDAHDPPRPGLGRGHSLVFALAAVAETQSYAGFFTSSPKVTLVLHPSPTPTPTSQSGTALISPTNPIVPPLTDDLASWECEICAYRNPPGLSPSARSVCALCGVPRQLSTTTTTITLPSSQSQTIATALGPLSRSRSNASASTPLLPSSYPFTAPMSSASPSSHPGEPSTTTSALKTSDFDLSEPDPIPCPACTFHNHPSLTRCEICGSPLPPHHPPSRLQQPQSKSAPTSRPESPTLTDANEENEQGSYIVRLSFRKGGDKSFYAQLKRALLGKAWEVCNLIIFLNLSYAASCRLIDLPLLA